MKLVILLILQIHLSSTFYVIDESLKLECNLNNQSDHEALSANNRAKTDQCKQKILTSACFLKVINSFQSSLTASPRLETKCPLVSEIRTYEPIGCLDVTKVNLDNLFSGKKDKKINFFEATRVRDIEDAKTCIDYCIFHSYYAVFNSRRSHLKCACIGPPDVAYERFKHTFKGLDDIACVSRGGNALKTGVNYVYETGKGIISYLNPF